jgi:hypothetical protein
VRRTPQLGGVGRPVAPWRNVGHKCAKNAVAWRVNERSEVVEEAVLLASEQVMSLKIVIPKLGPIPRGRQHSDEVPR